MIWSPRAPLRTDGEARQVTSTALEKQINPTRRSAAVRRSESPAARCAYGTGERASCRCLVRIRTWQTIYPSYVYSHAGRPVPIGLSTWRQCSRETVPARAIPAGLHVAVLLKFSTMAGTLPSKGSLGRYTHLLQSRIFFFEWRRDTRTGRR